MFACALLRFYLPFHSDSHMDARTVGNHHTIAQYSIVYAIGEREQQRPIIKLTVEMVAMRYTASRKQYLQPKLLRHSIRHTECIICYTKLVESFYFITFTEWNM